MKNTEQPCLPGFEDFSKMTSKDVFEFYQNTINSSIKFIPLIDLISTYQGEGPNCGKRMVLSRFKYCNKHCPFCDTYNMMMDKKTTFVSLKDIDEMLKTSPNLMITGGEPTLDNKVPDNSTELNQLTCTLFMISALSYDFVDIETNGYKIQDLVEHIYFVKQYKTKNINVSWSPKFIIDKDWDDNIQKLKHLIDTHLTDNVTLKVVIGDDLEQYKRFVYTAIKEYGWNSNKLYLMPKGTNLQDINESMKEVLNVASDLCCNISTRLHIIHNFI